jgi:hypothetical protein
MFLVICINDGAYHLATHTVFRSRRLANWYRSTISPDRRAIVVHYDGRFLRDDAEERFGKHG